MQAIQSIDHAALEIPRPRSPFRALLWKEWRQQRWIFLSLAGLAYALLVASAVVFWPDRFNHDFFEVRDKAAAFLCGCAAFIGIISIVILSANAFAGEREDNSEVFLGAIPCSRNKLFWVKLGLVLSLAVMEIIPLALAALLYARQNFAYFSELTPGFALAVPVIAAAVLIFSIVPAFIASFGGSVIATILASIPVAAACLAYMRVSAAFSFLLFIKSDAVADNLPVLFTALMLATMLLAARRMWVRVERTWRGSLRTSTATAGALIAYVVAPALAIYVYATLFAPLSFFAESGGRIAGCDFSSVSPDGRFATFTAHYNGWGLCAQLGSYAPRAALVDARSGRTRWLTRFRDSFMWPSSRFWSPSGDRFVLDETGNWLWPFARPTDKPDTYFVVDASSGEKRSFAELCPGLPPMSSGMLPIVGWYSDQVFALQNKQGVLFADIEHHDVLQCKTPDWDTENARLANPFRTAVTERGIFVCPQNPAEGTGEIRVLRYAPDLAEAESFILRNVWGIWPTVKASADGQWLLARLKDTSKGGGGLGGRWYLVTPADLSNAELLFSYDPDKKGLVPSSLEPQGFLPHSHKIFLSGKTELGLFDADTHDLRTIAMPESSGWWVITRAELSPAGGFAFLEFGRRLVTGSGYAAEEQKYAVADLQSGASWTIRELAGLRLREAKWLGDDHLLLTQPGKAPWIIDRHGGGVRPLLK